MGVQTRFSATSWPRVCCIFPLELIADFWNRRQRMKKKKMGWVAALLCIGTSVTAWAQLVPEKPVQIVVPFSAGGPTDLLARTVAVKLEKELNHSVIVQNRPGGGGSIGAEYTARATPDGHTLMLGSLGTQAINPEIGRAHV